MAQPAVRLPPHLQPRLKAAATSSSTTSLDALVAPGSSTASRSSSRTRTGSPLPPGAATESSNAATEALIRRTLCPYSYGNFTKPPPLGELLPPLTSSNEVDLQLYAIIAVVVKEFVYSWYGKITPDQSFVEEIVRIVAHCTRDLEQRLRRVDVLALFLDEVPALVCNHISAQNASRYPPHPSCLTPDRREVYHTLNPHPAFSPVPKDAEGEQEQERNERYYRQLLVHGALAVLLPTEDLQSPPLRILVSDVFGEMILGKGVGGKACEAWLIWDGIAKLVASLKAQIIEPKRTGEEIEGSTRGRLERFGLLHGHRARQQAGSNGGSSSKHGRGRHGGRGSALSEAFWRTLQYIWLAFVGVRFVISGLISASSAPGRGSFRQTAKGTTRASNGRGTIVGEHDRTADGRDEKENIDAAGGGRGGSPMTLGVEAPKLRELEGPRPVLSYALFGLVSQLLDLRVRMPWIYGLVNLIQWHLTRSHGLLLGLGVTDGPLDKFLHALISEQLLKPSRVPNLFLQLRSVIFPHNALGPPREVPSIEEQKAIRRRAAEAILSLVPRPVAKRLFAVSSSTLSQIQAAAAARQRSANRDPSPSSNTSGGRSSSTSTERGRALEPEEEATVLEVEAILNIFEDSYMNKHLIFSIVELLFVRLMPEIGEKGVRELLEERGVAV